MMMLPTIDWLSLGGYKLALRNNANASLPPEDPRPGGSVREVAVNSAPRAPDTPMLLAVSKSDVTSGEKEVVLSSGGWST